MYNILMVTDLNTNILNVSAVTETVEDSPTWDMSITKAKITQEEFDSLKSAMPHSVYWVHLVDTLGRKRQLRPQPNNPDSKGTAAIWAWVRLPLLCAPSPQPYTLMHHK